MTIWNPEVSGDERPVYLAVARAIERAIESGELRNGDRLPTHRKMARALGLSVGSVTRAYAEAEARGLIRGEVGRGTFVGGRSGRNRVGSAERAGLLDLAVTWPLHALDPDLGPSLRRLSNRSDLGELLRYPPHAGSASHRSAGARWAGEYGIEVGEDRVLVCAGVQHGLAVALGTIAAPGDVVAAEAFTYPGVKALAGANHLRLAPVAMDEVGILPDDFERLCRSRRPVALYTIPTIQNPTNGVLDAERRRAIAGIARQHGVWIVEDDVHRLLHPDPPPSFASLAPDLTISLVSLSKVVAGGLRVAYLIAPSSQVERLTHTLWATTWMAAPLTAQVAADWIQDGTAAATARRKREEAAARQEIAREILNGIAFRSAPNSYHLWIPLEARWSGSELALLAERRGVSVSPGDLFAVIRGGAPEAVRVSLTGVDDRDMLRNGLRELATIIGGTETVPSGFAPL